MSKYEAALIELSRAKAAVSELTTQIGDASKASFDAQTADGGKYIDWLNMAYQMTYEETDWGGTEKSHVHHDGDPAEYLREKCVHSLRAHELIQLRKLARKRLGLAKRRITVMANTLAKHQEAA